MLKIAVNGPVYQTFSSRYKTWSCPWVLGQRVSWWESSSMCVWPAASISEIGRTSSGSGSARGGKPISNPLVLILGNFWDPTGSCQNCRFPHAWEKQLTLYEVGGGGGCDLCHEKAASACVTLCGGQAATASGQTRSQEVTWTDRWPNKVFKKMFCERNPILQYVSPMCKDCEFWITTN